MPEDKIAAADPGPRRLFYQSGGFLVQRRIRRILELAGHELHPGLPGRGDGVVVWGQSPTAWRGERIAARRGCPVVRVEDAFLRSVLPARAGGGPPLGLLIDTEGVHFDPRQSSGLERILAEHALNDLSLLQRSQAAIARIKAWDLSKYNHHAPDLPPPAPGYILLIDQTEGDAALRASGADRTTFQHLLAMARADHPDRPILIRTHPETRSGHRRGHFTSAPPGALLHDAPVSPWAMLANAHAVYTVSSQMGFEAILAGHRPVVLGQPFYAGWGLTEDRAPAPLTRRGRSLTPEQLFAGAMILFPRWYDPFHDRLCSLETALDILEAQTRAWRDDRQGWVATGMRLWKRKPLQQVFGRPKALVFEADPTRAIRKARSTDRRLMVWAGRSTETLDAAGAVRVEDGFLRSRGLGADLIPPLSLCLDDLGIYYDPGRPSRLEALINASESLSGPERDRAERLIAALIAAGITKYNLGRNRLPPLPPGRKILVPGQVEDDASIRLGAGTIRTNRALLQAARAAHPQAVLLYKPHPDVEAGLRPGIVPEAGDLADLILDRVDATTAIAAADEVWTMTSGLGFEALIRGKAVTCTGQPFYAGWGLTTDLGPPVPRRRARPDLPALIHATLIAYPRYFDPVTRGPCPPEIALHRLATGTLPRPGPANRLLAKAQGLLASHSWLWR